VMVPPLRYDDWIKPGWKATPTPKTPMTDLDDLSDIEDDPVDQLSTGMRKSKISTNPHNLILGDCLVHMNELEPRSIDCIINDPPYGSTDNTWDKPLDLEKMWECYLRVLKPHGTVIMFCCSDVKYEEPLLHRLMLSKPKGWKFYTLVYLKDNHGSPFQCGNRPMKNHEDIIVFYKSPQHTYNPQMWEKKQWGARLSKNNHPKDKHMLQPRSILPVFPRQKTDNSTSKPVGTMEWLVKTYSDEYDTVLDNTMGSGSTGVACANTHRNFVGIEADPEQFPDTFHRIDKAYKKTLREEEEEDEAAVDPVSIELPERRPKFDVDDYTEFYEKVSQLSDYDLMVSWLVKYINQYFCVVVEGNEIIEFVYGEVQNPMMSFTPQMEEEKEKIKWALSYTSRKAADMKLRFRKCEFYAENGKKANLYDAWSSSKESREYEKKVFDPMRTIAYDDKNILNTFAGLKAEQEVVLDQNNVSMHVYEEDFAPILYHVKNLCGGNDMYYEYLLDWLAYPIQTGEKTNVAVISHGGQG
jgi:site-specific DNA-methyltransferase (adenine-specific)